MYAFLAKFEELNSNMKPIEALAAQMYPLKLCNLSSKDAIIK